MQWRLEASGDGWLAPGVVSRAGRHVLEKRTSLTRRDVPGFHTASSDVSVRTHHVDSLYMRRADDAVALINDEKSHIQRGGDGCG